MKPTRTGVAGLALMLGVMLGLAPAPALAHKPSFPQGEFTGPANAYPVVDPRVSIVLYSSVTCDAPELWTQFQAENGFSLFVQLLIPRIDRLADYRPALAVVGPGLPEVDAPGIALPDGLGAIVFDTRDVTDPKPFDEPVTMTQDWILVEDTVTLAQPGMHYVVAWDPEGRTGKLALAIGTLEQFGFEDFGMLPEWTEQTRTFHETADYPPAFPPEEQVCSQLDDEMSAEGDPPPASGSGEAPAAAADDDTSAATGDDMPAAQSGGEDEGAARAIPLEGIAGQGDDSSAAGNAAPPPERASAEMPAASDGCRAVPGGTGGAWLPVCAVAAAWWYRRRRHGARRSRHWSTQATTVGAHNARESAVVAPSSPIRRREAGSTVPGEL